MSASSNDNRRGPTSATARSDFMAALHNVQSQPSTWARRRGLAKVKSDPLGTCRDLERPAGYIAHMGRAVLSAKERVSRAKNGGKRVPCETADLPDAVSQRQPTWPDVGKG